MKTIILTIFAFIHISIYAQTASVNDIIEKFEGKDGITTVVLTKDLINAVTGNKSDSSHLNNIIRGISSIKILVIEKGNPDYKATFESMVKKLPVSQYKDLMVVKDGKNHIKMIAKDENGKITDFILSVTGDNEYVLINIMGVIDLKKLSRLGKELKISGLEHLAKLDKKQN